MNTQEIIKDIKKAVLYQHKALVKSVDICRADKFILTQNRLTTRNILVNIQRLEDKFIFKNHKSSKELISRDTQILEDILLRKEMKHF